MQNGTEEIVQACMRAIDEQQAETRALIDADLQKRLTMAHTATQLVFIGLVADLMQGPFKLSKQEAIEAVCKTHPAETQDFIKAARALGGIVVPGITIADAPELKYLEVTLC